MPESGGRKGAPIPVNQERARKLNEDGWGIFHVVNEYRGPGRTNPKRVCAWFVDFDGANKATQLRELSDAPLHPSCIVESRAGYHAYWFAKEASLESWDRIVKYGLQPYFQSDPKSTDVLRLLRCPGYLHWKEDPFLVSVVRLGESSFSPAQMGRAFPGHNDKPGQSIKRAAVQDLSTFWGRVDALHCGEAIIRLGGHWLQGKESFQLSSTSSGNENVVRSDGYSTGCFVRPDGSMGGCEEGPRLKHWLRWYGHSWGDIAKGLLEVYPELEDEEEFKKKHGSTG